MVFVAFKVDGRSNKVTERATKFEQIFWVVCVVFFLGALGVHSLTAHPGPGRELRSAPSGPDDWHRVAGKRALASFFHFVVKFFFFELAFERERF